VITEDEVQLLGRVGGPVVSGVDVNIDGAHRAVRADVLAAFEHPADGLMARARAAGGTVPSAGRGRRISSGCRTGC
jgi:hypothetical protein